MDWVVADESDSTLAFPPLCNDVDERVPIHLGCSPTIKKVACICTYMYILCNRASLEKKHGHLANQDTWDLLLIYTL